MSLLFGKEGECYLWNQQDALDCSKMQIKQNKKDKKNRTHVTLIHARNTLVLCRINRLVQNVSIP